MKTKTKKILCVLIAVLFSISILVGVVFSCLSNKNQRTAYAEEDISVYDSSSDITYHLPIGYGYFSDRLSYNGTYDANSLPIVIDFNFVNSLLGTCIGFAISPRNGSIIVLEYRILSSNNSGYYETRKVVYDKSSSTGWLDSSYKDIAFASFSYSRNSPFYYFVRNLSIHSYSTDYNDGFSAGKEEGLKEGYNNGFTEGKEEGVTEGYNNGFTEGKEEGVTEGYNNGFTAGKEEGVTEGYNNGFTAGKEEGVTEGYNNGFTAGKTEGITEGYNEGYEAGKLDSDNYDEGYTDGFKEGKTEGFTEGFNGGLSTGKQEGYTEGYGVGKTDGIAQGKEEGYTNGYADGLNKGQSDSVLNPVIIFIEPVHRFMNTPLFGSITLGVAFNVVLFVAIACIFIKMFAGG